MKVGTIEQLTKRNGPKTPNRVAGVFLPQPPQHPVAH